MKQEQLDAALQAFKNESENQFTRIDSEQFRCYEFAGKTVRIENPLYLSVSASGGHRLFDAQRNSHYIPAGWVHLYWQARADQPHFVK